MPRIKTFLYAVRMLVPGMDPQPIKVGFSTRPDKRREHYRSGPFPCEWLGVWPGNIEQEHALHRHYAHLAENCCGEWFIPNDEMLLYVMSQIERYQKRLDRYARFAVQKAEWLKPVDKETMERAVAILESDGEPN